MKIIPFKSLKPSVVAMALTTTALAVQEPVLSH